MVVDGSFEPGGARMLVILHASVYNQVPRALVVRFVDVIDEYMDGGVVPATDHVVENGVLRCIRKQHGGRHHTPPPSSVGMLQCQKSDTLTTSAAPARYHRRQSAFTLSLGG